MSLGTAATTEPEKAMLAAFNLSPNEIIIILLIAVLLFGAKKLPEIGRGLGKGIREFKDATKNISDDVKSGLDDDERKTSTPAERGAPTPPERPGGDE